MFAKLSNLQFNSLPYLGVQELTRSGLNGVSGEGLLKDKSAFFEPYKSPTSKRRKLFAKLPVFLAKRVC